MTGYRNPGWQNSVLVTQQFRIVKLKREKMFILSACTRSTTSSRILTRPVSIPLILLQLQFFQPAIIRQEATLSPTNSRNTCKFIVSNRVLKQPNNIWIMYLIWLEKWGYGTEAKMQTGKNLFNKCIGLLKWTLQVTSIYTQHKHSMCGLWYY